MRLFLAASCGLTLGACFNVTSPDNPPPTVAPPTIACQLPVDASCMPTFANDASSDDAAVESCDAGPPIYYDNTCTLPPSVCADSHWAAYFDNGTCVDGTCQLVTKYHYCATGCYGGGCLSSGETAANRGF